MTTLFYTLCTDLLAHVTQRCIVGRQ